MEHNPISAGVQGCTTVVPGFPQKWAQADVLAEQTGTYGMILDVLMKEL